jgi:two-component system, OmpR family, phosphate regulon sensor histidine kinase PhoR
VPFRSALFRKLLVSAFALIAITILILDAYLTRFMARQQTLAVEQQLAAAARILAGELALVEPSRAEAWARDAAARAQARITLITPGGAVLADSEHDPETMENHSGRPEVREALAGRTGIAFRHSDTLGRQLCYLALPVTYRGQPRHVLRLAVPLKDLNDAIAAVRSRILGASLVAAAAALVMAYFFSRFFAQRIRRLQVFAEGLFSERAPTALPRDSSDELGALAGSLSRTSAQLHDLVDNVSLESARRQAILASMVEGVLAVDNELRVTFCNESFARAVGVRADVPAHLPVLELVRDPGFLDMLSRVLVTHESVKRRMQLAAAEGRWFEVQAAPLSMGSRRGAIAILHDITDLERLERIRKDFVANVSHELRTPLTAIRGYAETLLDGALEDEENNRKFLEVIRAHAIRLNNIASDLLVLSELESGQPAAMPEPVPIRAALEAAIRTVESEAHVRGVHLRAGELDDARVMGHRIRLEQAFVNLLDNAVKFNRPGGEVRIETVRTENGEARITIADTGIGIPSEDLPRIFERFYRVDKARSREVGGTGLGLSIVKHVIERMNGTITADSQLGKGSTFTVLLPIAA